VNRDRDHSSRSERFIWGIHIVAALGTPTDSAISLRVKAAA